MKKIINKSKYILSILSTLVYKISFAFDANNKTQIDAIDTTVSSGKKIILVAEGVAILVAGVVAGYIIIKGPGEGATQHIIRIAAGAMVMAVCYFFLPNFFGFNI